jgi:hypothetical protein
MKSISNYSKSYHNSHSPLICPRCGSPLNRIGAGRKPGEGSIACGECKKFIRWLSSRELKELLKGGEA